MIDKEKVIEGLQHCACGVPNGCKDCPYDPLPPRICVALLTKDALELLKEREPVAPYWFEGIWKCGKCGDGVVGYGTDHYGKFCPVCGRRVKWNAAE